MSLYIAILILVMMSGVLCWFAPHNDIAKAWLLSLWWGSVAAACLWALLTVAHHIDMVILNG